jgi:hypothetical protein
MSNVNHFLFVHWITRTGESAGERLSSSDRDALFREMILRVHLQDLFGEDAHRLSDQLDRIARGPALLCASYSSDDGRWSLKYETAEALNANHTIG